MDSTIPEELVNNNANQLIDDEEIKKLRDFMTQTLKSTDDKGKPDMERIRDNSAFNMGDNAFEITGLLFQESIKLETMEAQLRELMGVKYDTLMNTRLGWSPTNEGIRIMLEGDEDVSKLMLEVAKQRLYVKLLSTSQEIIRFYPKNAQCLINVASYGKEIGKIL